jgi:hypothetical protein
MAGLVDIRGISPGYNGYSAKYPGADDDVPRVYDDLDDFRPPPKPLSSGVKKAEEKSKGKETFRILSKAPRPVYEHEDELDLNNFKSVYGNDKHNDDYYKKVIPGYSSHSTTSQFTRETDPDILLQKINYMINLLEEQQDERTNNVTEEVVLYSFLGIFIIFIVDSFSKTSKYVR